MNNIDRHDIPTMSSLDKHDTHFDQLIYLASPYTDEHYDMQVARYQIAREVAADLIHKGHTVFSPIAYSHPIVQIRKSLDTWDVWMYFDFDILTRCDEMWILPLDGWKQSEGINLELSVATDHDIPVWILPEDFYKDIMYEA